VHDELDISVDSKETCEKIIQIMADCVSLVVPNKVDAEIGQSWGEATINFKEYFNVT